MDIEPKRLARVVAFLSLGLLGLATSLHAGIGGFGSRRSVGGVMIDGSGVVRTATMHEKQELANLVQQGLDSPEGDLSKATGMRMISLKGLQQEIMQSQRTGAVIPDEVEFLAGLQRIEYVFVDKVEHDVLIAGPAEPWELHADGFVVGTVTGGSTMRLADLVVALRSVESARREGVSCSIEPTAEGRIRLKQLLRRTKLRPGQNPSVLEAAVKEAFGPQVIQLAGVPGDSRYARTLVAADFEMKRVAMGLTESQVIPSYLHMARNASRKSNQNPRWWMACDYSSLTKSEDGMSWKLSGQGVKTMTEQDIVATDGSIEGAGSTDKHAQQWATKMTEDFAELSRQMPVFSELQNIMDMTVVATLIVQERLAQRAGLELSTFTQTDSFDLDSYPVPKWVDPQCSFIRGNRGWVVTASGGVDIHAFEIVEKQIVDAAVVDARKTAFASATSKRWWWNP